MFRSFCLWSGLVVLTVVGSAHGQEVKDNAKPGYHTVAAKRGPLVGKVRAVGVVQPEDVVDVGAQVTGRIEKFGADPKDPKKLVDFGTEVEAGTVLAQLDPTPYQIRVDRAAADLKRLQAELRVAEVQLDVAQRDLDRAQTMLTSKTIAQADYDALRARHGVAKAKIAVAEAAVIQARADLAQAEFDLSCTRIVSPIKGVVIDRRCNVGQTVVANLAAPSLFLVATDLKKVQVWAAVPETDIGLVKAGQQVDFTVAAYRSLVFHGVVRQIRLNATLKDEVTYTVVIAADNANGQLLPYLTADVRIIIGTRSGALLVPSAALQWRPRLEAVLPGMRADFARAPASQEFVWVADKGFVRPIPVVAGWSDGTMTEIVEGQLPEGTAVVVGVKEMP
jgi:HlyD family secretion protein